MHARSITYRRARPSLIESAKVARGSRGWPLHKACGRGYRVAIGSPGPTRLQTGVISGRDLTVVIQQNAEEFAGSPVVDFDYHAGITQPTGVTWRLRLDWDTAEKGFEPEAQESAEPPGGSGGSFFSRLFGSKPPKAPKPDTRVVKNEPPFLQLLTRFLNDRLAPEQTALVIGAWGQVATGDESESAVQWLSAGRDRLPKLRALFFGDIMMEESEISWIKQSDVSPLLAAWPRLEHLRVRGGNGLSLGRLNHDYLTTLIVETGGLPKNVLHELAAARLPALEHLELWLGDDNYGWDGTVEDLWPLLEPERFPRLRHLGLRDSMIANEVAATIAESRILDQIETLDLSLGTLTDEGVEALLRNPNLLRLKHLDIHHHYVLEPAVAKLTSLGLNVDASQRMDVDRHGDEEHRYVAVSE